MPGGWDASWTRAGRELDASGSTDQAWSQHALCCVCWLVAWLLALRPIKTHIHLRSFPAQPSPSPGVLLLVFAAPPWNRVIIYSTFPVPCFSRSVTPLVCPPARLPGLGTRSAAPHRAPQPQPVGRRGGAGCHGAETCTAYHGSSPRQGRTRSE